MFPLLFGTSNVTISTSVCDPHNTGLHIYGSTFADHTELHPKSCYTTADSSEVTLERAVAGTIPVEIFQDLDTSTNLFLRLNKKGRKVVQHVCVTKSDISHKYVLLCLSLGGLSNVDALTSDR